MKQIVFLGLILLLTVNVNGQVQNVDSLENILTNQELEPDKKMQLYWDIISYCIYNDLDRTLLYAEKGIKLSKDSHNDLYTAKFTRVLGFYYMKTGDYDLSLSTFEKAIDYAKKAKSEREEVGARTWIAALNLEAGKHELALKGYIDLLPALKNMQPIDQYVNALTNIAIVYQQLHLNEKALEYCKQAITMAEKHNVIQSIMAGYALIGDIYYENQQLDSTIVNVLKAYEMSRTQNNITRMIVCTQILAVTYSDLEDFNSAEKYANECLDLAEKLGEKQSLLMAWSVMAKIKFDLEHYKESEKYAYKVWEADSTHLERAENATKYISAANFHLGNFEKATYFLNKYQDVVNKLSDRSLHENIADMEIKYETEKKEHRIASLEKERQLYVWLGVAGVLFAIASGIALWQKIKNAQREKQLIATRSVLEGEMKERTRLAQDLHDRLSGNLSAVKIELGNHAETLQDVRDKLDNCINDIRNAAHDLMPTALQFGMKVALEDFAAQFSNVRFHFFGEDKRIDRRTEFVVYCCANELVNNSIRHSGATNINLQLVQDEKHVTLTVSDDGCGFDESAAVKGFGLKSIHDRVASCNGKMDISTSQGKGTETTIELRIEKN